MANLSKHAGIALKAYRRNVLAYFLSLLFSSSVVLLILVLGFFAVLANSLPAAYEALVGGGGDPIFFVNALINPANLILFLLAVTVASFLTFLLSAGLYGICLKGISDRATMRTFFGVIRRRGLPYIVAMSVVSLIWLAIAALFLVPLVLAEGIFSSAAAYLAYQAFAVIAVSLFLPFFILVPYSVIFGRGASESIRESVSLGRRNYIELLFLGLSMFFLSVVLMWPPLIGPLANILFVTPMFMFVMASYYLDKSVAKKPTPGVEAPAPETQAAAKAAPKKERPQKKAPAKKPSRKSKAAAKKPARRAKKPAGRSRR
ncbi:MAG: hypothetical protein ACP5E4_01350 [Candidatus Aenigmatarchaeota archaeon]